MARRCIFFICCVLVPSIRAGAAEAPIHLGEIETRAPREAREAPSAFSTVIEPSTETERFSTTAELLSQTVGTHVRSLGGFGQFSTTSIRGSSAEQVVVLVDGVRINAGGTSTVDLATLPMHAIDRIEVIRGGGGAQFGGDAVGGVINIITKQAEPGHAFEIRGTGGSFLTVQSHANLAIRTEQRGFVLAHTHSQSRGDYSFQQATTTLAGTTVSGGGVFQRDHNRVFADDLLVKYDIASEPNTTINLTNDFFWTDRQLPGTEAEATLLAPTNPLEATQRIYRNTSHVGVRFDDLWTPRLTFAFGFHNLFEHARFDDASPAIGTAIDRTTLNDTITPYLRWQYTWPTAAGQHAVALRYEYRRDMFHDAAGNATTATIGNRARDTHQVVAQDEWTLVNDRLTVLPVVRFADASDFTSDAGGKLGLVVRPFHGIAVKANVENIYRVPNFSELYYPDEGYLRGNPNLAKEAAFNWDAGVSGQWDRGTIEVAYFQHRIRNSILFVPISATTIQPINTFAARAEGIEVVGEATPAKFARLSANYTWLRSYFTSTGLQLPGRPVHMANLRGEVFRQFSTRWGGKCFVDTQWVSRLPVNTANTAFLAARTTLDVGLTATFTTTRKTKYFGTVEAKDVTNVQIYDARGFPLPRRAFYVTIGAKWS